MYIDGYNRMGYLRSDECDLLDSLLESNQGISDSELRDLRANHPYASVREDNIHLKVKKLTYYTKYDTKLSNFILSKFGYTNLEIDFLYKITYSKGEHMNYHRDKGSSVKTILVLLNDDFEGGELFVNERNVKLNKRGKYIEFDGNLNPHEVTKVTKGVRNVLAIFLQKIKTSI